MFLSCNGYHAYYVMENPASFFAYLHLSLIESWCIFQGLKAIDFMNWRQAIERGLYLI